MIIVKSKHTESRIVRQRTVAIKRKAIQKVLDKFKEDIFMTMTYHKVNIDQSETRKESSTTISSILDSEEDSYINVVV